MQISIQTVVAAALLAPSVSCAPFDWSPWSRAAPSLSSDGQQALDAHNAARSEVGTAALVWDDTLASNAQAYGEELVSKYGSSGTLEHAQVEGEGENLAWQGGSGDAIPMTNAVNMWLSEKSQYNGEPISQSNYMNFGHYSMYPCGYLAKNHQTANHSRLGIAQAVWKDTTKVGMAAVSDGSGGFYVVGRYQAPGNYMGETAY